MKIQRYVWLNFLNLYFSKIQTIEFRCHEGSVNSTKCLIWLLICASILRYAEDIKRCFSLSKVSLQDVLLEHLGQKYTEYIMAYLKMRHEYFFLPSGNHRDYKHTEKAWFEEDLNFTFTNNMEIK